MMASDIAEASIIDMSPTKLSSYDKDEIIERYRQPQGSTSTLADHYGVSSSTISRFLKKHLTTEEYQNLVEEKKRINRYADRHVQALETEQETKKLKSSPKKNSKAKATTSKKTTATKPKKKVKSTTAKATNATTTKSEEPSPPAEKYNNVTTEADSPLEVVAIETKSTTKKAPADTKPVKKAPAPVEDEDDLDTKASVLTIQEMIGEEVDDDEYDSDDDDELVDEQLEDDDNDGDDDESDVEIMPLAEAVWPRVAYLIVDRHGELMTRPLQEFRYLGSVPAAEANEIALPIFDNHRVAKRYTNKREKVIKVPDCALFEKTSTNLRSKGISRILMKSNVYTLN